MPCRGKIDYYTDLVKPDHMDIDYEPDFGIVGAGKVIIRCCWLGLPESSPRSRMMRRIY